MSIKDEYDSSPLERIESSFLEAENCLDSELNIQSYFEDPGLFSPIRVNFEKSELEAEKSNLIDQVDRLSNKKKELLNSNKKQTIEIKKLKDMITKLATENEYLCNELLSNRSDEYSREKNTQGKSQTNSNSTKISKVVQVAVEEADADIKNGLLYTIFGGGGKLHITEEKENVNNHSYINDLNKDKKTKILFRKIINE